MDACERTPEPAFAINALAVDRAAAACAARGIAFATVSTDYVFDGALGRAYREDDAPNPLTAYGASKLAGELLVRRHGERHHIVRTSGVFGTTGTSSKGYTLIDKVLAQAERGEPTTMVADMVFSPSFAPHVARALRDVVDRRGVRHAPPHQRRRDELVRLRQGRLRQGGPGRRAARADHLRGARATPPGGRCTRRWHNTTFAAAGIAPLPGWDAALDEYLAARRERAPA